MNVVSKWLFSGLISVAFLTSSLGAKGWVMVDSGDGAQLVCCKKHYYRPAPVRRVVKKDLTPCDEIPTAKTMPLDPGERLAPANVKRCVSCDQKYGTIGQ
ncbi:MAG: hypothetical protein DSZ05_08530 [Sulfurospirillum sp.]|nr:MAG: hypothetical protein DSZ05_08530 [Sulfurospirillum sp.]